MRLLLARPVVGDPPRDEYREFRLRIDIIFALVRDEVTQVDRWPDSSPAGTVPSASTSFPHADSLGAVAQAKTMAPNLQVGLLTWLLPTRCTRASTLRTIVEERQR